MGLEEREYVYLGYVFSNIQNRSIGIMLEIYFKFGFSNESEIA